jgi:chromosome partitioning protein
MRRVAIINQKGGVGKTTTAVNLGAALAARGRRVVLVDLDPQSNLTLHLGQTVPDPAPSTYGVLMGGCSMAQAIRPAGEANLFVLPTNIHLSGAELELAGAIGRETILRDAVEEWIRAESTASGTPPADYVLFDCPPSLGLLSVNGLAAADEVFVAVQTEFFALQGMSKLVDVVQLVKRRMHPRLCLTGIVPCLYDVRLRLAREVLGEIRKYFPGQVFRTTIGSNVKLAEAPSFGQTILSYAPGSAGARDYRALAKEVLAQEPAGYVSVGSLPEPESSRPSRTRCGAGQPTGTGAGAAVVPAPAQPPSGIRSAIHSTASSRVRPGAPGPVSADQLPEPSEDALVHPPGRPQHG